MGYVHAKRDGLQGTRRSVTTAAGRRRRRRRRAARIAGTAQHLPHMRHDGRAARWCCHRQRAGHDASGWDARSLCGARWPAIGIRTLRSRRGTLLSVGFTCCTPCPLRYDGARVRVGRHALRVRRHSPRARRWLIACPLLAQRSYHPMVRMAVSMTTRQPSPVRAHRAASHPPSPAHRPSSAWRRPRTARGFGTPEPIPTHARAQRACAGDAAIMIKKKKRNKQMRRCVEIHWTSRLPFFFYIF